MKVAATKILKNTKRARTLDLKSLSQYKRERVQHAKSEYDRIQRAWTFTRELATCQESDPRARQWAGQKHGQVTAMLDAWFARHMLTHDGRRVQSHSAWEVYDRAAGQTGKAWLCNFRNQNPLRDVEKVICGFESCAQGDGAMSDVSRRYREHARAANVRELVR